MLVLVVLTIFFTLFHTSIFTFPLFLAFFIFYFLASSNFNINTVYFDSFFVYDELSFFLTYITLFVIFISFLFIPTFNRIINVTLLFMFLFCFIVFCTNNLFILYFSYESSLLPILFIIIKWGSYPERSLSAFILLIYTSIFTFPFIYIMFYVYNNSNRLNIFYFDSFSLRSIATLVVFFTFAVKLPIYGLHFWLPMAHVEAPTFGSMILAGVLLKLGGLGLIRLAPLLDLEFLKSSTMRYFIVFLIISTLVCCFQSDFKRLVAYSSVSHIITIPLMLFANNICSVKAILILIFFHGLRSPILFMLVGLLYSMFGTRQIVAMRGLVLISPIISFIIIMAFFFTLSAPPFPSFISEVFFILSTIRIRYYLIYCFLIFAFLSLVYNLNWLSSILFSSTSQPNISFSTLSYKHFLPLIVSFVLAFNFSLITIFLYQHFYRILNFKFKSLLCCWLWLLYTFTLVDLFSSCLLHYFLLFFLYI